MSHTLQKNEAHYVCPRFQPKEFALFRVQKMKHLFALANVFLKKYKKRKDIYFKYANLC